MRLQGMRLETALAAYTAAEELVDDLPVDGKPAIRFTGSMKATIEVPDDLYRQVKAKSALEGRAIREVAIELFRGYVEGPGRTSAAELTAAQSAGAVLSGQEIPPWFGVLEAQAREVERHDMAAIRESIGRGIATERGL